MVIPSDAKSNTNTLLLNDDSTTSRVTQLDIEQIDETNPAIDEYDETDMDDLPPLSTYLAGWKYWFQFAVWPFVFVLLNGVVVSTLVAFDEYEFRYGKRGSIRYHYDVISYEERNRQIPYEMMKYNRMIISILLFVDALIIYRAILFLDKKVRELDMIGDVNHDDITGNPFSAPTTSPILKPNVHAEVSRKLDVILGRNPQSRISIFVSILWLLFVGSGTVALVSVADLLFAISPKGKQVCIGKYQKSSTSTSHPVPYDTNEFNNNDDRYSDEINYNNTKPIENIPDELQEWAHTRHDMYSHMSNVVHLTNGVNYLTAANPLENTTGNYWSSIYGTPFYSQLVSTGVNGNITFYKNVIEPYSFTSIYGDNLLNSSGFCCIYRSYVEQQQSKNDDFSFYQSFDMSMLCTTASDTVYDGVFPNATLLKQKSNNRVQVNFETASIKSFNYQIYVQVISSIYNMQNGNYKSLMTFHTATLEANTLTLNQIAETSDSPQEEFENGPFFMGPGSPCYKWTRNIDLTVFLIVLGTASMWLTKIKNLSVGVVPGVVAVSMALSRLNHDLSLAISSLAAAAAFFGLLGCVSIPIHHREKLIWALYTLLFCVAGLIFTGRFYYYYDSFYNFERALVTIAIASLIGFILNHPVLYLFGWIGGIWAIFCGVFLLFTPPYGGPKHHAGIFAIGLGIIVGSGCATVGFNLTKYRAHVVYYSKRAWFAMNAAIQSSNTSHRGGRSNQNSTSTTTRYAPVMHTTHDPNTHDQEFGRNDITAGLLNQNTEGRTRSH